MNTSTKDIIVLYQNKFIILIKDHFYFKIFNPMHKLKYILRLDIKKNYLAITYSAFFTIKKITILKLLGRLRKRHPFLQRRRLGLRIRHQNRSRTGIRSHLEQRSRSSRVHTCLCIATILQTSRPLSTRNI